MTALAASANGQAALFEVGVATHAGRVRHVNEDRYHVAPELGVFAVADGMGGHEGGALASSTIVEALATIGSPVSATDLLARLEDRILRANRTLQEMSRMKGQAIGSTVAVLLTSEGHYACVWSGDSRIYRVRDGVIALLSRDHTEVRDLLERGILTAEEARTWPRRHVITKAIGVKAEPELEFEHGSLEPGDRFLLCSDGLTGHVGDDDILARVASAPPQAAADALLQLTLDRGAADNVTIVVLHHVAPRRADDGGTLVLPRAAVRADPAEVFP